MRINHFLSFIVLSALAITSTVSGPGCANIIPPEGGPRDSLPPVLRKSSPPDSTLRFNDNRITLTFDEYVEIDNYLQNLIVSPVPTSMPNVTRKLNVVSIKLRDSLEANTTYSLDFGNSIKDVNEGNIFKNFTYVFSTGRYIDTLTFSGSVLLAEKGIADSTLTVMLHRTREDSAVLKEKPRYVAKTNGSGEFTFRHLAPGNYYVYALQDQSGSYRYMSTESFFAFADSSIVVGEKKGTSPLTLYAYNIKKEAKPAATSATKPNKNDKRLKVSTTLKENKQSLLEPFAFLFETPLKNFDSSKVRFATDSTFTAINTYSWETDSTTKKFTLNYNWIPNTQYHLILEKEFATDTLDHQLLRADTISFYTNRTEDYGKLTLRFRNLDLSKNPVLQFVQSDEVVQSFPLTSNSFSQTLFTPGDYTLRILNDTNKNGKWDPGNFFGKHQQPELVKPIQRKITVKSNWENQVEIDVNATAPPADNATPGANRPDQQPGNNNRLRGGGRILQ
jgi:uncharacterized protein (DUF2141 family)